MSFSAGVLVYFMIWIIVLFLVLPWGVKIPQKILPGHASSAPENPHMGLKFLVTSVLSAFLWTIAYLLLRA